jgi:thymidylate kinase
MVGTLIYTKEIIMTGKFIVVEGLDGSGKTTLVKYLCQKLSDKYRVIEKSEPSNPFIIKGLTDTESINKAISTDRYLQAQKTKAELQNGYYIVQSRSVISGYTYSNQELDLEGYPIPDLVIFLKCKPETCLLRLKPRDEAGLYENYAMLMQKRIKFQAVLDYFSDIERWSIIQLDGELDMKIVHKQAKRALRSIHIYL